MGRPPCCDKSNVKRGLWTPEEDAKILAHVSKHGVGNWTVVPKKAGLNRCGKSCRLRWTNYLRPDLKHDGFTSQEEDLIINLHKVIGSRWSLIAKRLPGRTDNDVKNYWNTKLRKKLSKMGIDPVTHKTFSQILSDYGNISGLPTRGNQIRSNNKNLNTLVPRPEPSSVLLSGPTKTKMIMKPMMGQVQEYSSTINPSWNLLPQFQVINQPHFLNEVTSTASSSSSNTVTQFSSSQSYSGQPSQAQITPSSPFGWSEFLIRDPCLSTDFQQQEVGDFQGILLSTNSSTLIPNKKPQCKFTNGNVYAFNGTGVAHEEDSGASSSSANSFLDAILDRDSEMCSDQFPQLLDESFDY